jgi:predicted dehydrogenase
MKVLMVGLGSIGQRHLRNIRQLYGDNIDIIAYRQRGLRRTFTSDMRIADGVDLEERYGVRSFRSIDEALSENPDVAFITTITSEHINMAMRTAQAGCHLFIEKPLSDSMKGIKELREVIRANRLVAYMGFNMRYHPCLEKLKTLTEAQTYGRVVSVRAFMGERLEGVHEYEDYHTTYMANKTMGGGLVLTQLIHEFDYLRWLFGNLRVVNALAACAASLKIDVEDVCDTLLVCSKDDSLFPIALHGDFWQSSPKRYCEITFEKGIISADFINNTIAIEENNTTSIEHFAQYARNDSFIEEVEQFFQAVKGGDSVSIGFEDGVKSLELALNVLHQGHYTRAKYEKGDRRCSTSIFT